MSVALKNGDSPKDEKPKPSFGEDGYYDGFASSPDAAESGGRKKVPKKMNRIDVPRTKSIGGSIAGRAVTDSSSEDISVEKQMALEEGNAIKYRTCSWQKV